MIVEPVVVVGALVALALGLPGIALFTGCPPRVLFTAGGLLAAIWWPVLAVTVLTGALAPGIGVLCGTAVVLVATGPAVVLSRRGAAGIRSVLVLAMVAIAAMLPVILMVFGGDGLELYRRFGVIDFAGALPFAVVPGAMLAGVAILDRRAGERPPDLSAVRGRLLGALLLGAAVVAVVVAFELTVDDLSPVLAETATLILAAACGAGGVRGLARRSDRDPAGGAATGLIAGCAAALPGAAHLELVPALVLGLLVGLVGASAGTALARRFVRPLLAGGVAGLVGLGILAEGPGLAYSGQPTLLLAQLAGVLLAASWGLMWGLAGSLLARRTASARGRAS